MQRLGHHSPPRCSVNLPRGRQPSRNSTRRTCVRGAIRIGLEWKDEVASARRLKAIPRPHHASPNASASFANEPEANLVPLALPLLLQKQNSCVNAGCEINWSAQAVHVRPRSVGLMRMRSQRPWVNKRLPSQRKCSCLYCASVNYRVRMGRTSSRLDSRLSYGRTGHHQLRTRAFKEFPGVPEGTIDVIPVDIVVAAITAVAAAGPDDAGHHTGCLRWNQSAEISTLVNHVSSWFTENPLYDNDGQPIVVPEWRFPGAARYRPSYLGRRLRSNVPNTQCRCCR